MKYKTMDANRTEIETKIREYVANGKYQEAAEEALGIGDIERAKGLYEHYIRSCIKKSESDLTDRLMQERNTLDEIAFVCALVQNTSYKDGIEVLRTAGWYDDSHIPYKK